MLWKSEGFILTELTLSLSALLMTCLFFSPILVELSKQSRQLELEEKANQLIYEELQALIINGQPSQNHSTVQNGVEYQVSWSTTDIPQQRKVCVKVDKNSFHSEINVCQVSE